MTVSVGDVAPILERTITLTDMIAYAGATWDWHRLHYDPAYLAAHGVAAPVVDGQLFGALLVQQAQDWLGPTAFLTRVHFRFATPVYAGETVRCTAEVTASEPSDAGLRVVLRAAIAVVGAGERMAVGPAGVEAVLRP